MSNFLKTFVVVQPIHGTSQGGVSCPPPPPPPQLAHPRHFPFFFHIHMSPIRSPSSYETLLSLHPSSPLLALACKKSMFCEQQGWWCRVFHNYAPENPFLNFASVSSCDVQASFKLSWRYIFEAFPATIASSYVCLAQILTRFRGIIQKGWLRRHIIEWVNW